MEHDLESNTYTNEPKPRPSWIRVGLVTAASALTAGVAAVFWYRKTLNKLQNAAEQNDILLYSTSGDDNSDDID